MPKDAITIKNELSMPFAPEDLEWRLQQTNEDQERGLAVPYVTNRAIQDRLDDVVGPENWYNDFKPWHANGKKESQICGIAIFFEEHGGFITKWDGAEDTDIEAIKGGLSDSMKRAAVQWGIGRVLYKMGIVWVKVEKRGRSWIIKDSERPRLDKAYTDLLKRLNLTPAKPGGLQSDLTPRWDNNTQQPPKDPEKQPQKKNTAEDRQTTAAASAPENQAPPTANKLTQLPAKTPECDYTVLTAHVQSGMNQNQNTSLKLRGKDGKTIRAFARGVNAALVPGAALFDVELKMKKQSSVVFYVLESYKIMDAVPKAA